MPIDDYIHGTAEQDALFAALSHDGLNLSAIEAKHTFCDTPGTKTILTRALSDSNHGIGHYTRDPETTLNNLANEGRVLFPTDHASLVTAVNNVQPDQIVVVPEGLLPNMGIRFLKKEHSVPVRKRSKTDRIDRRLAEELRGVSLTDDVAGYDFQGDTHTNRQYKCIALVDVIRGIVLHHALHTTIEARVYEGARPLETGAQAGIVQIPSFSNPHTEYQIGIRGIPVYHGTRADTAAHGGFDIALLSAVPRHLWNQIKFSRNQQPLRREGGEQPWDHHVVLAYERAADKFEESDWNVLRPYITPSANTLRFYWKSQNHVLVYKPNEEKKCGFDLNPVNVGQTEYLLWKRVGYINDRARQRELQQT